MVKNVLGYDVGRKVAVQQRATTVLVHVLSVIIICVLPETLMSISSPRHDGELHWWMYGKSAVMIGAFYINYFVIINWTVIRRHRWWSFVLCNIVLIIGAVMLLHYLNSFGWQGRRFERPEVGHWQKMLASTSFVLRDATMLLLTVSLSVTVRLSRRWIDLEQRQQRLAAAQRQSELASLRNQMNPHFLFNSLNSIYALIDISPAEAQRAVHELSRMLRYLLYENPETVSIEQVIDFASDYIELARLRLGTRPITVEIVNNAPVTATIAPLLFVNLIENALKYGNTENPDDPISIRIVADNEAIECSTENHVRTTPRLDTCSGVGLANLRRRLEILYGDHSMLVTKCKNGIYTANLRIPLK